MEQITIIKPNATEIDLMRTQPPINILEATQIKELGNVDVVNISFETPEILDIDILDKVNVFGEDYKLNDLPAITKNSKKNFVYNCTFEGSQYDLLKVQFLNADVTGGSTGTSFDITGNLKTIIDILINNLNRVYPAKWSLIGYPETTVKTLNFSEENCLSALQNICKEFDYEFEITQGANGLRYLNIKKLGKILAYQYQYGISNGLYKIARQNVDKRNLITRLYAYGSDKNLQSNYRNYSQRLRFNDDGVLNNTANQAIYGIIEGTKIFDDIFPSRVGTITAIDTSNKRAFFDSSMFDLNEADGNGTMWLIAGVTAKISVLSGNLAGYEFQIESYAHNTRKFIIKEYKDDRGEVFPSPTVTVFQFQAGDTYTILDIKMPASYIAEAEAKLQDVAQKFLDENSEPIVNYQVEVDELYLKNGANLDTIQTALKDGWIYTDINNTIAGWAQYVNGFIQASEGTGLGGITDSLGFLHRSIADGSSLNSLVQLEPKYFGTTDNIDSDVQFGLMIRFGLTNDAKFAALKIENGQLILMYRATVGGAVQTLGTNQAYTASTKYGIELVGSKVKISKLFINKFPSVINEIDLTLTGGELSGARIGYFISKTHLNRAVLKVDSYGSTQIPTDLPTDTGSTPLGAYNYINVNNGNLGTGTFENNVYVLRNAGTDVWDLLNSNLDSFGYLFLNIADSTAKIKAHLVQEPKYLGTNTDLDQFTRAGIMWRATNSNNSDYIAIGQNATGVILFYERWGGQSNVTTIVPLITNKTTIKDFYLKVVAASPGVSTRLMTVTAGYVENGQEVQIGIVSHIVTNSIYANSKLGIFQTSKSLTDRAVLNASILVDEVVNTNNPCGKPGDMGSDICIKQWGEIV